MTAIRSEEIRGVLRGRAARSRSPADGEAVALQARVKDLAEAVSALEGKLAAVEATHERQLADVKDQLARFSDAIAREPDKVLANLALRPRFDALEREVQQLSALVVAALAGADRRRGIRLATWQLRVGILAIPASFGLGVAAQLLVNLLR
jgi:hypothetical protein